MQKPLFRLGDARKTVHGFPSEARQVFGYGLHPARTGGKHPAVKPLLGFHGSGVLEIVEDFDGDAYWAVYTVKLAGAVYVLHAFKKKAKKGIATPQREIDVIKKRLKQVRKHHGNWSAGEDMMKDLVEVEAGSGNVFADLGFAKQGEALAKAELAKQIARIVVREKRRSSGRAVVTVVVAG